MTSATQNTRILLASRPDGEPTAENFRLETVPLPEPGEGEVLLRTIYLSLDPYMRGRMSAARSYAAPVEVGSVMEGGTVAEVVESRDPSLAVGDIVLAHLGWQSYGVAPAAHVRRLDPGSRADLDGRRRARHARVHRLRGSRRDRQAPGRRDRRGGGRCRPGGLGGGADRPHQGCSGGRHRRRS
ncbi:hypothetical protein [Aeromicrobium sp. UC242_57]|uniref:hypothetical protein n=1 Tax=Aeromicrobium sp. UC242_57 TaxID=3374624 RepID=UPI00379AEA92